MLQLTTSRNSQVLNRESNRNAATLRSSKLNASCTTSMASADRPVIL